MATILEAQTSAPSDPVSNVLKWILLAVAVAIFVTLGIAVVDTYSTTTLWQWLRIPGDILFAGGAVLMAWDFITKLGGPAARMDGTARRSGRQLNPRPSFDLLYKC